MKSEITAYICDDNPLFLEEIQEEIKKFRK